MKIQVSIKEINSEYSQEYADQYNFGEPGDSNWKYNWSKKWNVVEDVTEIKFVENQKIQYSRNGKEIIINEIDILECFTISGDIVKFAVSHKLIEYTYQLHNQKDGILRYYIYIKDNIEFVSVTESLIVSKEDLLAAITN